MKTTNVAIIGTRFMGKAHSNAWSSAAKFFQLDLKPVMKVACDLDQTETAAFADKWGWQAVETDWRKVVQRPDVDIVDICVPSYLHQEIAVAAAQNGKHIFCEKPIALTLAGAREMYAAAEQGRRFALSQSQLPPGAGSCLCQTTDRRGQDRPNLPLAWGVPAGLDHGSELPAHLATAQGVRGRRPPV